MAPAGYRVGFALVLLLSMCVAQSPGKVRTVCVEPSTHLIKKVLPKFPPDYKPNPKFNGTVVLRFNVDKTGAPERIDILKGDADLAAVAVEAIKQWRWAPLKVSGKATRFETSVTVNFEPR